MLVWLENILNLTEHLSARAVRNDWVYSYMEWQRSYQSADHSFQHLSINSPNCQKQESSQNVFVNVISHFCVISKSNSVNRYHSLVYCYKACPHWIYKILYPIQVFLLLWKHHLVILPKREIRIFNGTVYIAE